MLARTICLALVAVALAAALPSLVDDVVPEQAMVQSTPTPPPTHVPINATTGRPNGISSEDAQDDWDIEDGSFDYDLDDKVEKGSETPGEKAQEVNDNAGKEAEVDNEKAAADVHRMEQAAADDDARTKAEEANIDPIYAVKQMIAAFGAKDTDVNGETYGEELAKLEAKKAKEEAIEKAKEDKLIAKRNAEIAKYEKKDDAVFSKAFGKEVKDTDDHEVQGMEEASSDPDGAMTPEAPAHVISSKPKPYDGPGSNIDCDKASGDLMPGNECGEVHQPTGETKSEKALGNRDYSQPMKGSTKIDGLDPGAGVPGMRL